MFEWEEERCLFLFVWECICSDPGRGEEYLANADTGSNVCSNLGRGEEYLAAGSGSISSASAGTSVSSSASTVPAAADTGSTTATTEPTGAGAEPTATTSRELSLCAYAETISSACTCYSIPTTAPTTTTTTDIATLISYPPTRFRVRYGHER